MQAAAAPRSRLGAGRASVAAPPPFTTNPRPSLLSLLARSNNTRPDVASAAASSFDVSTRCPIAGGGGAAAPGARVPLLAAAAAAAARHHPHPRRRLAPAPPPAARQGGRNDGGDSADDSDREPDWDEEMSIFKQRTMRPNQLATLRQMEGQASLGKVLHVSESLAVLSGINPDAPLGTALAFVSGAAGVLLWHRSDDLAFAIVLGGAAAVRLGEGVECRVKGVLQLVDEALGPVTRKEFELWQSPADDAELAGRAVDFLGRPLAGFDPVALKAAAAAGGGGAGGGAGNGSSAAATDNPFAPFSAPIGMARTRPLVNEQVPMKSREQIGEALVTGVRAVDALTPLGRGASLLVVGPAGSGKTALARDAVLGQSLSAGSGAAAGGPAPSSSSSLSSPSPSPGAGGGGGSPVSPSPSPGAGGGGKGAGGGKQPAPGAAGAAAATSSSSSGRVRCFYASTTQDADRLRATAGALLSPQGAGGGRAHDPSNVTVFAASPSAPLGERLGALCAACAAAERVRDKGGHALVVLDDVSALSEAWEHLVRALVEMGPERLREGLVKDVEGRDMPVVPPPPAAAPAASAAAGAGGAAAGADAEDAAAGDANGDDPNGGLVEYEGMLVSGAVAQRRGFYSTLFMRAAKLHRALGGGTMTLLPLVPGKPATGSRDPAAAAALSSPSSSGGGGGGGGGGSASASEASADEDSSSSVGEEDGLSAEALAARYPSLTEEQRRKLGEALARRAREAKALRAAERAAAAAHELRTEIVEEFISISDGQAVMDPEFGRRVGRAAARAGSLDLAGSSLSSGSESDGEGEGASGGGGSGSGSGSSSSSSSSSSALSGPAYYALNPRLSVTRIGARAYERALAELAPQARLELAQADDAAAFGGAAGAVAGREEALRADGAVAARARRLAAALVQPAGSPTPLEELALLLFAVKKGYADAVPPEEMGAWAARAVSFVRQVAPRALREVAEARLMTAAAEKAVADALEAMASAGDGRGGVAAAAAARVGGGAAGARGRGGGRRKK